MVYAPGDSGSELVVWEEVVQGAGAEKRVASCQDASAAGLVKKSNCSREVVASPVLTKNDKPLGFLARAFAVGERLLQRERPAFWKAEDRKGGVHLDQTL